jgi:parallel beta-helix repeat protein
VKLIRLLLSLLAIVAAPCVLASTIHVPKDQPTIQAGIDVATNGDVVLVSPGIYKENIDFKGKAITVRSATGSVRTIIDGGGTYQTVSIDSGETFSSVLEGFTIRNGFCAFSSGFSAGGISVGNSSPTIKNNVVTGNFGVGIAVYYGAPLIVHNQIVNNTFGSGTYCSPAEGSGILLYGQGTHYGQGSVHIIGNNISHNVTSANGNGAGIYLWIGGAPLIQNNIIARNQAGSSGGAITMQNSGAPVIVQNLIIGNNAGTVGGGLDLEISNDGSTALVVNNTIAGNSTANESQGQTGPEVYISGFFGTVAFWNNIITGTTENAAVYCDPVYGAPSPSFSNNDAFSVEGGDYAGTCAGKTGQNGNISANPRFVNPAKRNYQLRSGSPAINAGSTSAPDLPKKDIAGHPRIVNGKIDMGAYEHLGKESDRK